MALPPVYTEVLGPVTLSPGDSTIFGPVPAGYRWIIVDIQNRMVNDGGAANLGLIIGVDGVNPWAWQCAPLTRRAVHWRGRQAVNAGSTIEVQCDGVSGDPGANDLQITYYKLSV